MTNVIPEESDNTTESCENRPPISDEERELFFRTKFGLTDSYEIMKHFRYMPQHAYDILMKNVGAENCGDELFKQQMRIIEFPWKTYMDPVRVNVIRSKHYMDRLLFGMDDAKYLVQLWLAGIAHNSDAPIRPLLLHGPPGTGKTTFASVLAKSVGRKLEKLSIPALNAAFELVGDKGYRNSDCGRIIKGIINAQEMPVYLIDEVDKAGLGGTLSSSTNALLNILDGTRADFKDEFFEVKINLTGTIFILTANDISLVSEPLKDRCQVIEIQGYFGDDRKTLLKDYTIPAIRKQQKLTEKQFKFTDNIVDNILNHSDDPNGGVRLLEKTTEKVALAAIYKLLYSNKASVTLTQSELDKVTSLLCENKNNKLEKIGFAI